jgi:hypothetical protein
MAEFQTGMCNGGEDASRVRCVKNVALELAVIWFEEWV